MHVLWSFQTHYIAVDTDQYLMSVNKNIPLIEMAWLILTVMYMKSKLLNKLGVVKGCMWIYPPKHIEVLHPFITRKLTIKVKYTDKANTETMFVSPDLALNTAAIKPSACSPWSWQEVAPSHEGMTTLKCWYKLTLQSFSYRWRRCYLCKSSIEFWFILWKHFFREETSNTFFTGTRMIW